MKALIFFILISMVTATTVQAQKWNELTHEQKAMKLEAFRADNQKYLKTTLGMTQRQIDDIDNVNLCYLGTMDRINRYAKSDEVKDQLAEAVSQARWAQIDVIMGPDKHDKYAAYLKSKIEKASKQ